MFLSVCIASLLASAAAFSPSMPSTQRAGSVALNAEMSKSIPFLTRPEKLDGSMPGDMGFDPMGLSEIQTDLNYARWAELKHGRIAMLAITGMVVQESGIHLPGDQFTEAADPFAAVAKVGFLGNMQIFLAIGIVELINFNKYYGDGVPGDIGWGSKYLDKMNDEQKKYRMEQEVVHGRLAMLAISGAVTTHLMYHQPLLSYIGQSPPPPGAHRICCSICSINLLSKVCCYQGSYG